MNTKTVLALATMAAALTHAQTVERKTLTIDGAKRVIAAGVAQAHRNKTTGAIAVVDDGGNLMAVERIDGTFPAASNISIGKARTAAIFKHPTKFFEEVVGKGRTSMVALNDFTPLQGGVPIMVDGQLVGAVGVSGASSAQEDEELAETAANSLNAPLPPVSYFAAPKVEDAFGKGAVLFDGSDKYMVHASRREKPGMAEVHSKDADIIYVLDGKATFVTGGKSVDSKPVASDEYRGRAIDGGETREIAKGDVIIVPAGVPHWFKEVTNPFLYYVVKAR